jgi:hypothetical protein
MTKRRKMEQKRYLSDKGDNSSGNSSSDQSLTAISTKENVQRTKTIKRYFFLIQYVKRYHALTATHPRVQTIKSSI